LVLQNIVQNENVRDDTWLYNLILEIFFLFLSILLIKIKKFIQFIWPKTKEELIIFDQETGPEA